MRKILKETTQFTDGTGGNHIYIFEDYKSSERNSKVIAYVPFGTGPVVKFRKPLKLDLRGRTFEQVA